MSYVGVNIGALTVKVVVLRGGTPCSSVVAHQGRPGPFTLKKQGHFRVQQDQDTFLPPNLHKCPVFLQPDFKAVGAFVEQHVVVLWISHSCFLEVNGKKVNRFVVFQGRRLVITLAAVFNCH